MSMSNVALQDVYANNLQQNRGYPLRRPNFPSSPEGLRIGDVGHVDETGAFHVHCNIRFPKRNQFQAIQLDEDPVICKDATAVITEHSFFTGVKQPATTQESGIYEFTATTERGAILILPSGATLYDLQDRQTLDKFQEFAIKHARLWCRSTGHNSLYLITGLYQTSSWTLASFHGRRDVDGEKVLVQKSADHLPVYQWKPEFPNLDSQSCHKDTQFEKQTVLIKGFKMKVRPTLGVIVVRPVQESPNFTLLIEYLMCLALLLEYLKRLASQFGDIIPPITSITPYPILSRQPHHLDVVNNYLLENSNADVVVTHDDVWIKLLEKSKSMVIQESELLEHVEKEYNTRKNNNAIWLERILEDPNDVLAQETESSKPRVVITHICAENVTVGLGHVPVGFFVRIEIDGDTSRSTENKPALVDDHNIQWNDRIYLPYALSTKVRLVLCASFEFSPMLGSGEPIGKLELCVSDLLARTRPFTINESMPRSLSLLVSVQRWYGNNWMSSRVDGDRKEHSTLSDVTDLTDEGHHALLGYYRNYNEKDLESSITSFTQALNKCPKDDPRRVAALCNLAKAQFLSDQFHCTHHNFHHSTSLFEEALRLRAGDHRDRPMTLLYLSQALLYYRASGLQVSQSTLRKYINELETICPRDTHARRAADLVLQTYELFQLKISDDLKKLNELIPKWVRAADEVPEGHFDKPVRFDNIGLALQRRFQLYQDATDLKKAVEWFEKAMQITPDGHLQKSTYEDHLSDARLYQWAMVALMSSSVNEALDAAVEKFKVPQSHVYWAICDVLAGSNRVLEAIECFHKMQDELLEMHTPDERAWEVDFRRRCVKRLEEKGDTFMESRDLNTAIECYSTSLSLSPTNISDIIVKCCEARAGLLEERRLIDANKKFHVYRALCDDLEGSDRVPEAITCFRKMQAELSEISVPDDQAEWEVDFRRRCVTKLEKQGDTSIQSKDLNAAIKYYSIALSLDPTNISDIKIKCDKARAGLLEAQRLIDPNSDRPLPLSYPQPLASGRNTFYVTAIKFRLATESLKTIWSIKLYKNHQPLLTLEMVKHAGGEHQEEFTPPLSVSIDDHISVSITYSTKYRKRAELSIDINLHDNENMCEQNGVRSYRRKKKEVEVVVTVHPQFPPLIATTTQIIQACSRFRILIIGNSGVGKSSLIHRVFGVPDVNLRGEAEIEREFSPANEQFVVHEGHMKIVEEFVAKRRRMSDMKDQLHAIWLCLELPYAGGRLLETDVEDFLKRRKKILGDIPLVVVLTKVDLLDAQLEIDLPDGENLTDFKSKHMEKHCIQPLCKVVGNDVTHAAVSVLDGYAKSLSNLFKTTGDNMIKYRVGDAPRVMAAIAQHISIKEKIELSISIVKQKYWNTLLKSAAFRGHTLDECLKVIRSDITQVWNFNDPDQHLMDDRITGCLLRTDNLEGNTGAAVSSNGDSPAPGLYRYIIESDDPILTVLPAILKVAFPPIIVHDKYKEAKHDVKILVAYIVDLICLMQIIFILASGDLVTEQTLTLALKMYEAPRKEVHRLINAYDGTFGVLPGGRDNALEKIEYLIWRFSIADDQIQELREKLSMHQSLVPLGSSSS